MLIVEEEMLRRAVEYMNGCTCQDQPFIDDVLDEFEELLAQSDGDQR